MVDSKIQVSSINVADYLAAITDESRRADCVALSQLMTLASGQQTVMWGTTIVGFGRYHYKYDRGREGDSCAVGFSSRKGDITVYLTEAVLAQAERVTPLGKCKLGKGCLYIRKFADIDQQVLGDLIRATVAERRLHYG